MITEQATPLEVPAVGREDKIIRGSTNRTRKFPAPHGMLPTGRFPGLAEALRAFAGSRGETIRYIEQVEDDLRGRKTLHPVAGEVTCRECLLLIIGHPFRHLDQIREIKNSESFPSA